MFVQTNSIWPLTARLIALTVTWAVKSKSNGFLTESQVGVRLGVSVTDSTMRM